MNGFNVGIARYIYLLGRKRYDILGTSLNAQGASFASVRVYQDLTFDFTHIMQICPPKCRWGGVRDYNSLYDRS